MRRLTLASLVVALSAMTACTPEPFDSAAPSSALQRQGGGVRPSVDGDGDGYDASVDCDDADASIRPNATEIAGDGVDQNWTARSCAS